MTATKASLAVDEETQAHLRSKPLEGGRGLHDTLELDRRAAKNLRTRAARLQEDIATRRLAASAVAHRRNRCSAPAPASCSITRALAYPWEGGFVSLARAAGVERIEPGCAPQLSAACFAPTGDAGVLDLLAIAA
jgi:hypothetical protein